MLAVFDFDFVFVLLMFISFAPKCKSHVPHGIIKISELK